MENNKVKLGDQVEIIFSNDAKCIGIIFAIKKGENYIYAGFRNHIIINGNLYTRGRDGIPSPLYYYIKNQKNYKYYLNISSIPHYKIV